MAHESPLVCSVLLAGGAGTRLWPLSRELYPKQLVKFIGNDSLVQSTIRRLEPLLDRQHVLVVCGQQHYHEIARHMSQIGLAPEGKILFEPSGRNTAPAILLAVCHVMAQGHDPVLCVFPADHVIADLQRFHEKLAAAIRLAQAGRIVTFGIQPSYPETGYGYVEGGEQLSEGAFTIRRFVEKPDRSTAQRYLEAGNFYWNSGMFAFKASVIRQEYERYQPDLFERMQRMVTEEHPISKHSYEQLPAISIDYAIMEHTEKGAVLPSDFGWSDIGSWKSLYDFLTKDPQENVIDGDVMVQDTTGCFILGRDRLIATNHLKNLAVVDTPDSLFVSDLEHSRDVKQIVSSLKAAGRKEYQQHRTAYLPWGTVTLLELSGTVKVERIMVYPAERMPISREGRGSNHLVVFEGQAELDSEKSQHLMPGDIVSLSDSTAAHLHNLGSSPLGVIRICLGP
jgi:mannose-1-phosphate guanylyltransferase